MIASIVRCGGGIFRAPGLETGAKDYCGYPGLEGHNQALKEVVIGSVDVAQVGKALQSFAPLDDRSSFLFDRASWDLAYVAEIICEVRDV